MPRDRKPHEDEEGAEDGAEQCPVCHQEYSNGICPIRSSECPYLEDELDEDDDLEDEEAEEEEEDEPDEDEDEN